MFKYNKNISHATHVECYHPSSNGQIELTNRTIKKILRIVYQNNKDLSSLLRTTIFAYNTTPHKSTEFSPFYLIYGRMPHLPIELTLNQPIYSNYPEYCHRLESRWQEAKEECLVKQQMRKEYYKWYYDNCNKEETTFQPGDLVMRKVPYIPAVNKNKLFFTSLASYIFSLCDGIT